MFYFQGSHFFCLIISLLFHYEISCNPLILLTILEVYIISHIYIPYVVKLFLAILSDITKNSLFPTFLVWINRYYLCLLIPTTMLWINQPYALLYNSVICLSRYLFTNLHMNLFPILSFIWCIYMLLILSSKSPE